MEYQLSMWSKEGGAEDRLLRLHVGLSSSEIALEVNYGSEGTRVDE